MRTLLLSLFALALAGCPEDEDDTGPPPPPDSGVAPIDFETILAGLDLYVRNGCEACHCNAGEGGCNAGATRISGATYDSIDANLRFASTENELAGPDPWDPHPLKLTGASDEDIRALAAYLGSLERRDELDGSDTLLAEGYGHYVAGTCISCHLTSGQGSAAGAPGPPISGANASADNLLSALSGGVTCHPLQCPRSMDPDQCDPPPAAASTCSLLGRIEVNPTVELLTEISDDGERARATLAYFLSFIAPPPAGGEVEACNDVPGQICTLAGNGIGGFTDDGMPAASTLLYYPQNLDITDWNMDGSLDLAIVDWNNHRIRIVFLDQPFTYGNPAREAVHEMITVAGDGKVVGDDALNHPTDVTFHPGANGAPDLYIAGWHNQNIYRYINPLNTEDGLEPELRDQPVGTCDLACREDGLGIRETPIGLPVSIEARPDGRLLIAESSCVRIRELTITGTPTLHRPVLCNDPVRLFEQSTIRTIAGVFPPALGYAGNDGPALEAQFNVFRGPTLLSMGIARDKTEGASRLYVADSVNNVIRYLDLSVDPPTIHWFAGGQPCEDPMQQQRSPCNAGFRDAGAEDALFNFPTALWVHTDRSVYVVDARNNAIRRIDFTTKQVTTIAGTGRGGFNGDNLPATNALLNFPGGVAVHPVDGRVFISDTNNNRVRYVVP